MIKHFMCTVFLLPWFRLILKEHVKSMKPGSVIGRIIMLIIINYHAMSAGWSISFSLFGFVTVDLAAETGGNVETTVPNEVRTIHDVVHIGLTDLPSRLPTQSSTLYANNISKFLLSIGEKDRFHINLEDEVVRGSIVLKNGELLWPPPMLSVSKAAPAAQQATSAAKAATANLPAPNPFNDTLKSSLVYTGGMGTLIALGCASPSPQFTTMVILLFLFFVRTENIIRTKLSGNNIWPSGFGRISHGLGRYACSTFTPDERNKCNFGHHCCWRHPLDG